MWFYTKSSVVDQYIFIHGDRWDRHLGAIFSFSFSTANLQYFFIFHLSGFHLCLTYCHLSHWTLHWTGIMQWHVKSSCTSTSYLVRFPNCIVYSWVYNTQKTGKFFFDCFHSLHQAMHWYVSIRIGIFRVSSPGSNWKNFFSFTQFEVTAILLPPPNL